MPRYMLVIVLSTGIGVTQDVEVVPELTYDKLEYCTQSGETFKTSFDAEGYFADLSYMCVPVPDPVAGLNKTQSEVMF